ncbi:hypothetical protein [Vandammella animalimorsus]|uniref:hypothetical protein n=1 Tax=Vandammella animalimorsus TaxID=2029117 RepID=UPI00117820CB|nr:hypothetical protein [Vandammella animalimorsus]
MRTFRFFAWVFFGFLMLGASARAQSDVEEVSGLLVNNSVYSSISKFSDESGDLIIYFFKNKSKVGRSILSKCVPELYCAVRLKAKDAEEVPSEISDEFDFSAAFVVQQVVNVEISAIDYDNVSDKLETRYGVLGVDDENRLTFNGVLVHPEVEGNYSLELRHVFEDGDLDLALVEVVGGTACPALFRLIEINAKGVRRVTEEFGSCSDYVRYYQRKDGAVVLHAIQFENGSGFKGGRGRLDFVYKNGVLKEFLKKPTWSAK